MLMASPGKGNTTSKPRQSFNKFFQEKSRKFSKTLSCFDTTYISVMKILLSYNVIGISCNHT
jgi:hypothetical protein